MNLRQIPASVERWLPFLRGRRRLPLLVAAAVGAVVVLAAVVRIVSLADNPPGFFCDEASFGFNAYSILQSGEDEHGVRLPLFFRAFGEYKFGLFIYSQVPLIAALGLTEFAVRLTSAIYGTLTVLAVFLLGWALFRHRGVGLAAAFFLAIMPWHIHFSRIGMEIVTFPFFLAVGLCLFLLSVRRPRWWPVAGVVLGLTLYSYRAAWVVLPPLGILLAVLYWRELLRARRWALFSLGLFVIIAIPTIMHLTGGETDRAQDVSIFNQGESAWDTAQTFFDNYRTYFTRSYLFDRADEDAVTRHYLPGYGNLYYIQIPFLLIGVVGLLWPPRREKLIPLVLLLLYPVPGAITVDSPISSRAFIGSLVFALITGYGLFLAADGLLKWKWRVRASPVTLGAAATAVLLAAVAAIALNNFASYLQRYHQEYPKLSAGYWGWQAGPKEIIEYFQSVEDDYDQFILDGAFNAPSIFYRFYTRDECGPLECIIGGTDKYRAGARQLFALRPESMPPEYRYVTRQEITYPDDTLAFSIVEIEGRASPTPTPEASEEEEGEEEVSVPSSAAERDHERRAELMIITAALSEYQKENGSFPSTGGNLQGACSYPDIDRLCIFSDELGVDTLIDPRGDAHKYGYFYESDGTSFTLYATFELQPPPDEVCADVPLGLADKPNLVCVHRESP
jgi:4-amino-4-deoxy-L-arabinose transferase-like glycosyltransferase